MSTTALFIELLITGMQAGIWLLLLISTVFGVHLINPERIKGFEAIIAVFLLPIVYPAGVLVDHLSASLFRKWERGIRAEYLPNSNRSLTNLLPTVKEPVIINLLGYLRSRVRICRASALNFGLITITGLVLTLTRLRRIPEFPFWRALFVEIVIGTSLTILAVFAWRRINRDYYIWVAGGLGSDANVTDKEILDGILIGEEPLSSKTPAA